MPDANEFQGFTPQERECISQKIPKLRDEGMEEDQAIAVAIKECAPGKSQPSNKQAIGASEIGGLYRAEQANDGTWTIFDVEVFAAHEDRRFAPPDDKGDIYDQAWLRRAIDRADARFAEGYLAPLHIRHHGLGEQPEAAGRVFPRRIERRIYEGKPLDVLLADLVGVPDRVFQRVEAGELPYRSVEVLPDVPEILSLALLDHEVPFFRFPMLSIGAKVETVRLEAGARPELAYQAGGGRRAVLFKLGGAMPDKPTTTFQKDDDEEKHDQADGEGGGNLQEAQVAAAESLNALTKALDAIRNAVMETASAHGINPEASFQDEEEEEPEKPKNGPVEMDAVGRTDNREFAALHGQVTGLRRQVTQLQKERDREGLFASALSDLIEAGYQEHEIDRKALRRYAELGKTAMSGYLAGCKQQPPRKDPPVRWTGELGGLDTAGEPKQVAKFAKDGPEALERARAMARSYEALPRSAKRHITLERFLETNRRPIGTPIAEAE